MNDQTLIDQIRTTLPIAPFVSRHTNGLKPTGPNFFTGRCPFHQPETDPPATSLTFVYFPHLIVL